MPVNVIIDPPVIGRRHVGLGIDHIADLTNDARIDDRIDGFPVVFGQPIVPLEACPFARRIDAV